MVLSFNDVKADPRFNHVCDRLRKMVTACFKEDIRNAKQTNFFLDIETKHNIYLKVVRYISFLKEKENLHGCRCPIESFQSIGENYDFLFDHDLDWDTPYLDFTIFRELIINKRKDDESWPNTKSFTGSHLQKVTSAYNKIILDYSHKLAYE